MSDVATLLPPFAVVILTEAAAKAKEDRPNASRIITNACRRVMAEFPEYFRPNAFLPVDWDQKKR